MVTVCSNLTVHSDRMLARLFDYAAKGLPLISLPPARSGIEQHRPIRAHGSANASMGARARVHAALRAIQLGVYMAFDGAVGIRKRRRQKRRGAFARACAAARPRGAAVDCSAPTVTGCSSSRPTAPSRPNTS